MVSTNKQCDMLAKMFENIGDNTSHLAIFDYFARFSIGWSFAKIYQKKKVIFIHYSIEKGAQI